MCKCIDPSEIHLRVLRELVLELTRLFHIQCFSSVLVNFGGSTQLEVCQCDIHLQEGSEGGFGRTTGLSAKEGHGTDHLECHYKACVGQHVTNRESGPACMGLGKADPA